MGRQISEVNKALVIAQARKLIEILESPDRDYSGCVSSDRAELRSVMASVRRYTMEIDKEVYPRSY